MKKLKPFGFVFLLLFLAKANQAQSFITIDGSQVFSNFKFINSNGEQEQDFKSISSGAYSLGYRYSKREGLLLRFNLGMRKGGSTISFNNQATSWNLQYCDLRFGAGYELNRWRLKPYLSAALYYSFLLKASQHMDGLTYDLKSGEDLKASDFGILLIPGMKAFVSDYLSIYAEVSLLTGLQNIETDKDQSLYNRGLFLTLGIAATLTKSKPKWLQGRR